MIKTAAGNSENQDRAAVVNCNSGVVLVIADGAGGLSGGTKAAVMAVELVRHQANQLSDAGTCATVLRTMDQHLCRDKNAGETTCALAVVRENWIFGASVGDSGVWIVGSTAVVNLTNQQARRPFIGSGNAWPKEFTHQIETKGGKLLLATDGLLKYASAERIVAVCCEPDIETCAAQLVELVRFPSGTLPDDITVILVTL
jgi:serine/threonine protein phosphatase PrpC